ncbi:MAG TPA: hypothetical protein VKP69_30805 [Isosphaeraceae bacterium]|nr:hypothetical protein [Isosphaeraceae bacterium]
MASDPEPSIHDPELDPPRTGARRARRPVPRPQEPSRLLANPFLTASLILFGLLELSSALRSRCLPGLIWALITLAGSGPFLHYHCLDCGATGLLFRWRRHECERAVIRRNTGRTRRLRGPDPTVQTIIWGYFLLGSATLAAILCRALAGS